MDCSRGRCRGETNSLLKSDGGAGGGSTGGNGLRCGDTDVCGSLFSSICDCDALCSTTGLSLVSSSAKSDFGVDFNKAVGAGAGAGTEVWALSTSISSPPAPLPPPVSLPPRIPSFSLGPSSVPGERDGTFQAGGNRSCLRGQSEYGKSRACTATSGQSGPR